MLADDHQNLENRIAVNAGDALDGANRTAFDEQPHYGLDLLKRGVHPAQVFVTRLAVGLAALTATVTLLPLAGPSKLAAFGVAVAARHFDPCFLRACEPE